MWECEQYFGLWQEFSWQQPNCGSKYLQGWHILGLPVWTSGNVHLGHRSPCRWSSFYHDWYICWTVCHWGFPQSTMEKVAKCSVYSNHCHIANIHDCTLREHPKPEWNEWSAELFDVIDAAVCRHPGHHLHEQLQHHGGVHQRSHL